MIHVAYGLYDKDGYYSKFTGTSILSMFENTSAEMTVHILHDNTLTQDNRDKFNFFAGKYNQTLKFYNVEILCKNKIAEIKKFFEGRVEKSIFSIATFYRLFITDVLDSDIEKIIYLDSDTIINLDIKELWRVELENKPLAAVTEISNDVPINHIPLCLAEVVKYENYFNAGILLMNLNRLKTENVLLQRGTKFIAENPKYVCFDQDILNYCFSQEYLKLPLKFNQFVKFERDKGEKFIQKKIYHYNARVLNLNISDIFNRLWLKYFAKTVWFNEETIGNIFEGIKKIYTEQKDFAIEISKNISGKTRAFFVASYNVEAVKEIFLFKNYEEIILEDSPDSLQRMVDSLNSPTKKFFFLFSDEYHKLKYILTRAGFKENEDFINGIKFFSDNDGRFIDSYSIIKRL